MNLRIKTLGVMLVALLAIMSATYLVADHIVAGGFASLERAEARDNLGRTEQALDVEMKRMDTTTVGWSAWDESYQFVQDGNKAYVETYLYDAALVNLHVDMMLFVNNAGAMIHAQAVNSDGVGVQLDESTLNAILSNRSLFEHRDTQDSHTGIVTTPAGPLAVASRPIVTNASEGPIPGSLLMARWVDSRLVSELRDVTKLDFAMSAVSASAPSDLTAGEQRVVNVNSDELLATTVIPDVSGAPALEVRLVMPRTFFAEGKSTVSYLLISLLALGIAFAILIVVMLELTVLRPVARLSTFVSSVGTSLISRAPSTGRDEIGHLGRSINGMLDTIEQSSAALTAANSQLQVEQERVEELNLSLEAKVVERTGELEMTNSELRDRNRQLIAATKRASTDGLTGLKNHRSFQEDIRAAADRPPADGELVVFMADIDRFKGVNDEHGHQAGDRILTSVGNVFRDVLGDDSVFRYGGDEFAMMTWVSSLSRAEDLAETVRQRVMAECTDPAVTVSIGVALYRDASSPEELVYHADAAMYAAKAAGKNRVRVWTHGAAALPAGGTASR